MTIVRVKGFQHFKDRHGKWRCYHRKTRIAIDLTTAPFGTAEFFAECEKIASRNASQATKPGTLGLLIEKYRGSPAFGDLAPRTKESYQRNFDYLKPLVDEPLVRFTRPLVVQIRDKAAATKGRKFANDVKARFSGLFAWGTERGYITANVASGIKDLRRKRGTPDANRPWSDEERHAVLDASPVHMELAIALMMFTGLAPDDALKLPRSFYCDGEIATRRAKTGEPVFWAAPSPLVEILAKSAGSLFCHLVRELKRPLMDRGWFPRVLAQGPHASRGRGPRRPRADPVRPAAYLGRHSPRDGL